MMLPPAVAVYTEIFIRKEDKKMAKYEVSMSLACTYLVDADNEEDAIMIADNFWYECVPDTFVEEVNENEDC